MEAGTARGMAARSQGGFTLVEACVTVGILSMTLGGVLFALASFGGYGAHQAGPRREAATLLAHQIVHTAQDAWKYGSPGNAPSGTWTVSSPPMTVTATLSGATANAARLRVEVAYTPDPNHRDPGRISVEATLPIQAPFPASTVQAPGLIPMPARAP